jgi:hypothetical protein
MPFVMSYTGDDDRVSASSFWLLAHYHVDRGAGVAQCDWVGWASNAARLAGKDPLPTRKIIRLTGVQFTPIFGPGVAVDVVAALENIAATNLQFTGATRV